MVCTLVGMWMGGAMEVSKAWGPDTLQASGCCPEGTCRRVGKLCGPTAWKSAAGGHCSRGTAGDRACVVDGVRKAWSQDTRQVDEHQHQGQGAGMFQRCLCPLQDYEGLHDRCTAKALLRVSLRQSLCARTPWPV